MTVVHADKLPMTPNFGQQPRLPVTIQPAGVLFDPPAPISVPNVDGLAPGEVTELYSFDHDLGQFVSIGTGAVSEDGLVIASDPGVGIIKGGWHFGGSPAPTAEAEQDQCSKVADDTAQKAQEFATTNPDAVPFTNIQACIAKSICDRAKPGGEDDFESNTWAKTMIPRFVNRFLDGVNDPSSNWLLVLETCKGQIGSTACAEMMAFQHIERDLLDALSSMEELKKKDKLIPKACGTLSDWEKVFDDIETCIENEPTLEPIIGKTFGAAKAERLRNRVRRNCQDKLREED